MNKIFRIYLTNPPPKTGANQGCPYLGGSQEGCCWSNLDSENTESWLTQLRLATRSPGLL